MSNVDQPLKELHTERQRMQLAEFRVRLESDPGLIKRAREAAGLTVSELADLCASQPPMVSMFESGKRKPTGKTGLALALFVRCYESLTVGEGLGVSSRRRRPRTFGNNQ